MPFDNLPYGELANRLGFVPANHSHAVLFGAAMKPVFDEHGEPVPDFRRLVREDTGKTLEVVGKSYAFIDNRAIFGEFEKAIAESGLDSADMMVGTDFANDGRRCFRTYIFPRHTETIRPGVDLALRIVMFNSFDRSMSFTGRAGHYSFVCANQAIVGKDVAGGRFAIKHTGELQTAEAITGLVAAAEQHVEQVKRLRIWPQIEVSDSKARELICAMDGLSDKQIDHLVHSWVRAKDDLGPQGGPNLWSMFATMTAWATHGDTAAGGMATGASRAGALAPKVRAMREDQVAKVIECEEWADLEAAG